MNTIDVMKQALEALDELRYSNSTEVAKGKYYRALSGLNAAIEQMEKAEPVGMCYRKHDGTLGTLCRGDMRMDAFAVYAHPAPAVPSYEESKANCLRQAHGGID